MMPAVLRTDVHRAEAYVMAENTMNLKWIMSLGGEIEGTLRGYGRGGEDFVVLGWRRENVSRQKWGKLKCSTGLNNTSPNQIADAGSGRAA